MRTASQPAAVAPALRAEALSLDSGLPLHDVKTMDDYLFDSAARRRFNMLLLGIFAAVALMLAGVGIYGVTSYSVNQRTREIGIRMALGARRSLISTLVLRQSIIPVVLGIALGIGGALALTRFISSLLFEVSATDPATFASVGVFMVLVAVVASYLPARRATRVDPMMALRCE
jgi:putative ABC transport system permease protein